MDNYQSVLIFSGIGFKGSLPIYLLLNIKIWIFTTTSLNNVESAIDFIKSDYSIKSFGIDTSKISIIGYSYGGGMALLGSLFDRSVQKVISIAGGDLSVVARMIEESSDYRKFHQQFLDQCMADSTISRGLGGKASHELVLKNRDVYDIKKYADKLAEKDILLPGGWLDQGG